jgi:predicted nucleotidyltransferase
MVHEYRVYPQEIVIAKLKQALAQLGEQLPIKHAYLFGSYARGQAKPCSDVDVAIRVS